MDMCGEGHWLQGEWGGLDGMGRRFKKKTIKQVVIAGFRRKEDPLLKVMYELNTRIKRNLCVLKMYVNLFYSGLSLYI
jgi:hypothetical protein